MCRAMFFDRLMGAGKSTIGRHLAELLEMEFVDADNEIAKRTGASSQFIFEIKRG